MTPFKAEIDTKLRTVFPSNLAAQLCTSHSCRENIAPNFICSFQPIKCKHLKLRFFATIGTCYSSQMPSSRLKSGKKLRNTSPSKVCQHSTSTAQVIVAGKIRRVLYVNFECLFEFWPIKFKCKHSKPRFWVHFSHVFTSQMPSLSLRL